MLPSALGCLERLQLPDVRRPDQMPSLPAWVASRIASLKTESQPDRATGKCRPVLTLPKALMLNAVEREELEQHVAALKKLYAATPREDARAEPEMLIVLAKMTMSLNSQAQTELSAEAKGEAYMAAVDDLPVWAVQAGLRRWHRGDCGTNNKGQEYDYHWCPSPAELRHVSWPEMFRIRGRAEQLERLLSAEELIEFTEEHCDEMRRRLGDLAQSLRTSLVGKDGSGGAAGKKPADGAHCGTQPKAQPGLKREGGCRRRGDRRK